MFAIQSNLNTSGAFKTTLFILLVSFCFLNAKGQSSRAQARAAKNARFNTQADADTTSTNNGNNNRKHHVQLSFELPSGENIKKIHLEVSKPGNSGQVKSVIIPIERRNGRFQGVGVTRMGDKIWLDLGMLQGNPNYRALIKLEDDQGQLSSPVTISSQ